MSLKEILGEELFNQVTSKLGDQKIDIVSNGNWIPKDKFDAVNNDKKTYKSQVDGLNIKLGELQGQLKDNGEATKTIEALQKTITDNEAKMKDLQKDTAIKLAIKDAKVKDADVISLLIDKGKIEIAEDGTMKGLDEQLTTLKESKAFLFAEETTGMGGSAGNHQRKQQTSNEEGSLGKRLAESAVTEVKTAQESTNLYFK